MQLVFHLLAQPVGLGVPLLLDHHDLLVGVLALVVALAADQVGQAAALVGQQRVDLAELLLHQPR